MFGGRGLYCAGQIFGIEVAGEVYLKADDASRSRFEQAGSRPFTYHRDGKSVSMSYWLLPDAAVDDPSAAARWGRLALEAAARTAAPKSARLMRKA
jgi:DNA transformation protein